MLYLVLRPWNRKHVFAEFTRLQGQQSSEDVSEYCFISPYTDVTPCITVQRVARTDHRTRSMRDAEPRALRSP